MFVIQPVFLNGNSAMNARSLLRSFFSGPAGSPSKRRRPAATSRKNRRYCVEPLEDRRLLAVFHPIAGAADGSPDSLREAISTANSNGEDDVIHLAAGTYEISIGGLDDANARGDLDLTEAGRSLTIRGAGSGATIIRAAFGSSSTDRVFHVRANVAATMEGFTVTGGRSAFDNGGGILNQGNLTLVDMTVSGNSIVDTSILSADGFGAGIHNTGMLEIRDSAVTDNHVQPTYGGWGWSKRWHSGKGGGLSNAGTAIVRNSTVSSNSVGNNGYLIGEGGGIYNTGALTLGGVTIAGNRPDDLRNAGGSVTILDRPAAGDDFFAVDEDGTLVAAAPGVLANDSDPNGDPLTAVLVAGPSHGRLTLRADGSLEYTPNAGFAGDDSFTYQASDGAHDSNIATVAIQIRPVNDAPVAVDDAYYVAPGEALDVGAPGVLANDSDPDGDPLAVVQLGDASHGTLVLFGDGAFSYTPNPGFEGEDQFTYRVHDGQFDSNVATVTINVGTIAVTTTDDEDDGFLGGGAGISLREAVRHAPAGAVVDLPAGVYALTRRGDQENAGRTGDLDIRHDLTIRGAGAPTTIIDASPLAIELSRGVLSGDRAVHVLPGAAASIRGVTITGGRPDASTLELNAGGAVLNEGELTIADSILRDNHSVGFPSLRTQNGDVPTQLSGGAIHNTGVLSIAASTIAHNRVLERRRICFGSFGTSCSLSESTGGEGGGIWNSGSLTMIDTTITANEAHNGGGVSNKNTLQATGSVLSDNRAIDFGGGLHSISTATDFLTRIIVSGNSALYGGGVNTHGTIEIAESTFSHNAAVPRLGLSDGGGLLVQGLASATVTDSTFSDNTADLGGGIHVYSGGTLRATNTTISGNTATEFGGGLENRFSADVRLTHVTVTGNRAGAGGGIHVEYHPVVIANTIVAGNFNASRGDDIDGDVQASYSLVESTHNTYFLDGSETLTDPRLGHNLIGRSAKLGPLADHGGATRTHELEPGSPAIDAGSNALAVDGHGEPLAQDQRGLGRIANGGAGLVADMGSFELQQPAAPANDPPAAEDDRYTVESGQVLDVDAAGGVLANDSDPDGDALAARLLAGPAHGDFVLHADGSFTYRPESGFSGVDDFTYVAGDGKAESAGARVVLDVTPLAPRPPAPPAPEDPYDTPAWVAYGGTPAPTWPVGPSREAVRWFDVNEDGHITPFDVLMIVNRVNRRGLDLLEDVEPCGNCDVNKDGYATALDALMVINHLNS